MKIMNRISMNWKKSKMKNKMMKKEKEKNYKLINLLLNNNQKKIPLNKIFPRKDNVQLLKH